VSRCLFICVRRILVSPEENQEENIADNDDDKVNNVVITQKEIRIILEKLKGGVQKYGENDTFQLSQKLQVQCTYIITIMNLILL